MPQLSYPKIAYNSSYKARENTQYALSYDVAIIHLRGQQRHGNRGHSHSNTRAPQRMKRQKQVTYVDPCAILRSLNSFPHTSTLPSLPNKPPSDRDNICRTHHTTHTVLDTGEVVEKPRLASSVALLLNSYFARLQDTKCDGMGWQFRSVGGYGCIDDGKIHRM